MVNRLGKGNKLILPNISKISLTQMAMFDPEKAGGKESKCILQISRVSRTLDRVLQIFDEKYRRFDSKRLFPIVQERRGFRKKTSSWRI